MRSITKLTTPLHVNILTIDYIILSLPPPKKLHVFFRFPLIPEPHLIFFYLFACQLVTVKMIESVIELLLALDLF